MDRSITSLRSAICPAQRCWDH